MSGVITTWKRLLRAIFLTLAVALFADGAHAQSAEDAEKSFRFGVSTIERGLPDQETADRIGVQAVFEAARAGHPQAQRLLASSYLNGQGVEQDVAKAEQWYWRAIESGDVSAAVDLATIYKNGYGVEKDLETAFKLFEAAADAGDPAGQAGQARFHIEGLGGVAVDFEKGFGLLKAAAAQGYAPAEFRVAQELYSGRNAPKDHPTARSLLLKAAESGYDLAQYGAALMLGDGEGGPVDLEPVRPLMVASAEQGFLPAMKFLIDDYLHGLFGPVDNGRALAWTMPAVIAGAEDVRAQTLQALENMTAADHKIARDLAARLIPREAFAAIVGGMLDKSPAPVVETVRWIKRAAELGDMRSQITLAEILERGELVGRDLEQAHLYRVAAAVLGDAASARRAGDLFLSDDGVGRDQKQAARFYQMAAENGDPGGVAGLQAMDRDGVAEASRRLGALYENGQEVEANPERALSLYLKAANAGDPEAQNDLGAIYATGANVDQNFVVAIGWYKQAMANDSAVAAANLGHLYYEGDGVKQDFAEAKRLFRISAEGGSALGQYNLARMLARGEGAPEDIPAAYYWVSKALASKTAPETIKGYASVLAMVVGLLISIDDRAAVDDRLAAEAAAKQ